MNVFKLWWALTKLVLAGRGGYDVGAVPYNPFDLDDPYVDAIGNAANWQVTTLHWVGGEDRFAVLTVEPDKEPVYTRGAQ